MRGGRRRRTRRRGRGGRDAVRMMGRRRQDVGQPGRGGNAEKDDPADRQDDGATRQEKGHHSANDPRSLHDCPRTAPVPTNSISRIFHLRRAPRHQPWWSFGAGGWGTLLTPVRGVWYSVPLMTRGDPAGAGG